MARDFTAKRFKFTPDAVNALVRYCRETADSGFWRDDRPEESRALGLCRPDWCKLLPAFPQGRKVCEPEAGAGLWPFGFACFNCPAHDHGRHTGPDHRRHTGQEGRDRELKPGQRLAKCGKTTLLPLHLAGGRHDPEPEGHWQRKPFAGIGLTTTNT